MTVLLLLATWQILWQVLGSNLLPVLNLLFFAACVTKPFSNVRTHQDLYFYPSDTISGPGYFIGG